jgi:hypothetical protein
VLGYNSVLSARDRNFPYRDRCLELDHATDTTSTHSRITTLITSIDCSRWRLHSPSSRRYASSFSVFPDKFRRPTQPHVPVACQHHLLELGLLTERAVPRQEIVRPIEWQPQSHRNPSRIRCMFERLIRSVARSGILILAGLPKHCPRRGGGGEGRWREGQDRHGGMASPFDGTRETSF